MRVVDSLKKISFAEAGQGQCFLHGGKYYVKAQAHIPGVNRILNCGGQMTDFAVSLMDGQVQAFSGVCSVEPVSAEVVVSERGAS